MLENNKWVEETLINKDIALIGFADLSEIDANLRHGLKYGISIGMVLNVLPSITDEPSIEYYNEYQVISKKLSDITQFLVAEIKKRGFTALPAKQQQSENFRTPIPFKTLATRAGLGWIGKSAALITEQYGNAIRLNGVLTDMPFVTGTPINVSFCGDCMECVDKCPGKAIAGKLWDLNTDRDDLLDAQKCKKTVSERGKIFNVMDGTCGICITVCPWTKKYVRNALQS